MQQSHFKAKIALEAIRETKTVAQVAAEYGVHPNMVTRWKQAALAALPDAFKREDRTDNEREEQQKKQAELYEQIGRLTTQVVWLKKNLASSLSRSERMKLLERENTALPLLVQADLLSVSRASLYYQPVFTISQSLATGLIALL
jgi:putative transposase